MKTNHILFCLLVVMMGMWSCKESFLDLTDPNAFTSDKFYKTEADIDAAVIAAYTSSFSNVRFWRCKY
jgi:starch-binding outer membrane protein, SusD/RagB family